MINLTNLTEEQAFEVEMVLYSLEYDFLEKIKFYKTLARETADKKEYWLAEAEKLQRRYDLIYGRRDI